MGYSVKKKVIIQGIGIHSGLPCSLTIHPSENGGIRFLHTRTGLTIPLKLRYIKPQNLGTNLVYKEASVKTIEHLMAVLWYLKLTDLIVEVDGDEIPIMDGSGKNLLNELNKAGRNRTTTAIQQINISKPFTWKHNDTLFVAHPGKHLSIRYIISFLQNPIQNQIFHFKSRSDFMNDIACARTFGNIEDVEKLHSSGRALGATMDNALVYNSETYLGTPRFKEEAVRHKILDLIGDLYSSGCFINGEIFAYKTSHATNHLIVKSLLRTFEKT